MVDLFFTMLALLGIVVIGCLLLGAALFVVAVFMVTKPVVKMTREQRKRNTIDG